MRLSFLFLLPAFLLSTSLRAEPLRLNFQGHLSADISWRRGPVSPGESVLRVEWKNTQTGTRAEPPPFRVSLFMPDMGHGSSPTQLARVLGESGVPVPGAYDVLGMYFTMPGTWEVRVILRAPGSPEEIHAFPVTL